jgi:hypothetical protein
MIYQIGLGFFLQSFSEDSSIFHDLLIIKGANTSKLLHDKKSGTPLILLSDERY